MIKEIYTIKNKEITLTVENNRISAVQKKDITKTGLRLYDNNCIGIAGAVGVYNENRLLGEAKQMLGFKMPYEPAPTKSSRRILDYSSTFILTEEDFFKISEQLLAELSSEYPQFTFNHKITLEESEIKLVNDLNTELIYRDKEVNVNLFLRHKESKNLMDSLGVVCGRDYDLEDTFKVMTESCVCYDNKVALPKVDDGKKMPVIFLYEHSLPLMKFITDLNGHAFGAGVSLFSGKVGEELFSKKFTLKVSRDTKNDFVPFFDSEGTTLRGDSIELVERGILKSPYSSKRAAKKYGLIPTSCGFGEYDNIPYTAPVGLAVSSSGKTIDELLKGRKAIYVIISTGANFTSQGEFATSIQSAFLYENGELLGRLPQLFARSTVFDMFGEDFIGLSKDGNSKHNVFKYLALDMEVTATAEWL